MPNTQMQNVHSPSLPKVPRGAFPLASFRILGGILGVLLLVALCVEQFLQRQTSATLLNTGWKQEDTRIKQNNLPKLAKLDPRFADLRPEAVLLGYVTNDPDMGIIPQSYKVYRMSFADDVFRWWLPELTEQFQARYTHKESLRRG